MFQYWDTKLSLELMGHVYVRAREKNFSLLSRYSERNCPLGFFALDHYHYARWIPVHIRDRICPHPFIMSFTSMLIGLSTKLKTGFKQCQLIKPINKTIQW